MQSQANSNELNSSPKHKKLEEMNNNYFEYFDSLGKINLPRLNN